MEWRFDGKVAIVTGAGRGLGRAHSVLLARRGAAVIVNDFDASTDGSMRGAGSVAEQVVEEIRAAGGRAIADTRSVAADGTAAALVDMALSTFGRLDIVVNNAGINVFKPFSTLSREELHRVMDVHFFGTAYLCQAAWPHLIAAGQGRIVNTVSAAAFGKADYGIYGAAKGAIFVLTRALAEEGAPLGIKVNAVAPLAISRMASDSLPPAVVAQMERQMPADLVAPIVGLMAHEGCPFTGEVITGCGGRASRWLFGEVDGFHDPQLSIESLVANLDSVITERDFHAWSNTGASSDHQRAMLVTPAS